MERMPSDEQILKDIRQGEGYYPIGSMRSICFNSEKNVLTIWNGQNCLYNGDCKDFGEALKLIKSKFPYFMRHLDIKPLITSQVNPLYNGIEIINNSTCIE